MRFGALALLLSALAVSVLTLPVAAAGIGVPIDDLPAGVGIRLLDVPADREGDPRARSYIVDHVIPGASVERTILVTNGTDEPLPIEMKSAPASTVDGWVVEAEADVRRGQDLSSWISFEPSNLVIAPQSGAEVEAVIAVPGGIPPGERYAAMIAEPPPVQTGAVGSVGRVGIRVYLSVGGDEPITDFTIDTLVASRDEEGVPSVRVGVLNTGGRAIDVSGEIELESEDGLLSAGPFTTAFPQTLGPQSRGAVDVPLPASLGEGPWLVTATMRSGLVERVATATLTIPSTPGSASDPADSEIIGGTDEDGNDISEELRQQRRTLLPIAALLILLALGGLFLLLWWQRRERDEDEESEVPAGVGRDDS